MAHINFRNKLVVVSFIVLISFPFLNEQFSLVKDVENTENRKPAEKPLFDVNRLDGYPAKFDSYYSDKFTIRQLLIKYYNYLNILVYKKSPLPDKLVIGNNGWLFMSGNELDAYRGMHSLEYNELEQIRRELEYRKEYLAKRNCKFYFVIAPVKANIYPEYMPLSFSRLSEKTWASQVIDHLNEKSTVKPIDITVSLLENKQFGLMYYKLDNHWNSKGAFFAASEILRIMHEDNPNVSTLNYSDYGVTGEVTHSGNITGMLSNMKMFNDSTFNVYPKGGFKAKPSSKVGYPVVANFAYPWDYEVVRAMPDSQKPKILIISDSFGGSLHPYISEGFSRSVKIFDAWNFYLNEDIVNSEKPDVVLLIVLEAHVKNLLKINRDFKKQ